MTAQIPTIPRQTQVSLNYWNATTSVDGCEFETVLQEPLWLNAGDSINVRNSSLDTSQLSNENIIIEEDIYLVFEWVTYAMLKKTTMDLQNGANDGSFHDTWIYGKDRFLYNDSLTQIIDANVNDNFQNYKMGYYCNPIWSYVFQSLWATQIETDSLATNRFYIANPIEIQGNSQLGKLTTLLGGWNTGSTLPNATGANHPLILVDGLTLTPIKRSTSIVLKKGNYTKSQIAIQITRQLVDLQAPESSVYTNLNGGQEPNKFQQNQITLVDASCPIELQNSVGLNNGNEKYYTFQSFTESAVNPFQSEIIIGSDFVFGTELNSNTQFMNSFNFPNIAPIAPATEVVQKTIPVPQVLNGVVNNRNYVDANGAQIATSFPVCFAPFTQGFRHIGNNVNIIGQDPDVNISTDAQHRSWFNDFTTANSGFSNQFDTNTQETYRTCAQTVNAFQTGTEPNVTQTPLTFLPCIMNMDAYWNYTGGVYGTNQFSLLYDPDKNIFSFNFLHTPIITNAGNTEPIPTVVRSRTTATNPYSAVEAQIVDPNSYTLGEESPDKRTDINERHSGIILTGLTSHYGSPTGADAGFWQKIGFKIEDICLPANSLNDIQKNPIPYSTFLKYTTGELYSISQNINVLNVNSNRNNEQMVIPDTFSMWANPQPQTYTPPAVAPPVPVGFDRDVLYASSSTSFLNAQNQPTSVLNDLGGNILIEITGYGRGSELQDVDAFAVKSIVSLFYLTGNTYLSSTGDSYTYYHQSTIPQKISKLKVRLLNPITKKKLTTLLGNNNSVYITVTQNQQITMEGAPAVVPPPKTEEADKGTEHTAK